MPHDDHWDDGPSVLIGPAAEDDDYLDEPVRPISAPRRRSTRREKYTAPPKPRHGFGVRLVYVLIFSILVLTCLVVYSILSRDGVDQIVADQDARYSAVIQALEQRLINAEERIKALERKLIKPAPATKSKKKKKKSN